jgi:hypothetical protein
MNLQELKNKYLIIYKDLKTTGSIYKLVVLLMLFLGLLRTFFLMNEKYYTDDWYKYMSHGLFLFLLLGLAVFWTGVLLISNSVSFVNYKRVNSFKYDFKQEFMQYAETEIPEINFYVFNQKMLPAVFNDSRLFSSRYSDYYGDDFIRGDYRDVGFEMCELHVFRLFSGIFHGIFVKCKFQSPLINDKAYSINDTVSGLVSRFEETYNTKIETSVIQDDVYIAVHLKDKFLKCDNERQIENMDHDFNLLNDLIQLIKEVISLNAV